MSSPEHGGYVKHFTDKDEGHEDEEEDEEDDEFPRIARSDRTHSLYRSTVDVTHI